jgi:hypothetical protein
VQNPKRGAAMARMGSMNFVKLHGRLYRNLWVNLDNVTRIERYEKYSRLFFNLGFGMDYVDIEDTPETFLPPAGRDDV